MNKLKLIAKIISNQKIVGYRLQIDSEQYRDVNTRIACKIADLGYIQGVKSNKVTGRLAQADEQVDLRTLKQISIAEIRRPGNVGNDGVPDCVKKALEKYNWNDNLVRIIKSGYKRYGILESFDVGIRQFWGRNEINKDDYQYSDVPNTEFGKMLSRISYDRDGQIYIHRDNLYVDTQVYESLAQMIIYVDLVFNDGKGLR